MTMLSMATVLVVDDEPIVRDVVVRYLRSEGFDTLEAPDGDTARMLIATEDPGLVVLDLMLPGTGGLELCRWIRARSDLPVIMLTARGEEADRIVGLEVGADDYVSKPFRVEEVLARVRALIRRAHGLAHSELRCGALALDTRGAQVTLGGVAVKLTSHEFRVLSYLMHRRGQVVSRTELTEHIYAQDCDRDSNTVEVFIARLRRKLGAPLIETVRGLGYRMTEPRAAEPAEPEPSSEGAR